MSTARFLSVSLCTATCAASLLAPVAWAQPPAAPPGGTTPAAPPVPADVQKAYLDIADLSLLRALVPVKLKTDQIDKILAPLQTIRAEGATRRKADETALRAVAAEVAKARDAALMQTPVPPETEAKIVKLFDDADKRFASAKKAAIDRVLPVLQANLTSEQRGVIKTYVEDKMLDGKKFSTKAKPDAVENAALELYIERVLLDERSIEVLTRLRAAAVGASTARGSASTTPPPASTPPAPPAATPPAP